MTMLTIKVECLNKYINKNVDKHFDWHEESRRLCEVTRDSAYAAGICKSLFDAGCHAVELCEKHGLEIKGLEYWED